MEIGQYKSVPQENGGSATEKAMSNGYYDHRDCCLNHFCTVKVRRSRLGRRSLIDCLKARDESQKLGAYH
eukprot:2246193-Rhodomonas_salina.2